MTATDIAKRLDDLAAAQARLQEQLVYTKDLACRGRDEDDARWERRAAAYHGWPL